MHRTPTASAEADDDQRDGVRRFARFGRVLPVALVQIVGTLLAAPFPTGPTDAVGPRGGPPWASHVLGSSVVDAAVPGPLAIALLVAGVVVLPWRWRWPTAVLLVTLATTIGYALLVSPRGPFVAALSLAAVNAWLRGRRTAAGVALGLAVAVLPTADAVLARTPTRNLDAVFLAAAWAAVTLSVAELVRVRLERVAERRRRRAAAEQERARDERVRIARELHDSVAHSMSLINLQAGVALHLGAALPEQTRSSLADIRDTSREALVELRTILGVLRSVDHPGTPGADGSDRPNGSDSPDGSDAPDGQRSVPLDSGPLGRGPLDGESSPGSADRHPVPGLDRLEDLVVRARAAGVDVTADVDGDRALLDRTTDRTAFRIVQESVTNVMKHAPEHRARIAVRVAPDVLELSVEDSPSPAHDTIAERTSPLLGPSGNGIIGMRERAAAVGGTLSAGPTPDGGWRVAARLPNTATATGRVHRENGTGERS
ncbi:sensor histidine kinase [Curtobacterium sp. HSID17257]|uniref:sensor histidine kinase n=1 Tax=Curtobacterium sp. HSID17257 TaxID=2419510 RepID=UPI000F86A893|nr:histidine kinase [Curtobacterium sp. HSID17257]RUQ07694.1 sensor histidine kinase [Curtobacterium sp. HSID17257]